MTALSLAKSGAPPLPANGTCVARPETRLPKLPAVDTGAAAIHDEEAEGDGPRKKLYEYGPERPVHAKPTSATPRSGGRGGSAAAAGANFKASVGVKSEQNMRAGRLAANGGGRPSTARGPVYKASASVALAKDTGQVRLCLE